MIDHITIDVSEYAACRAFYTSALNPLGYVVLAEFSLEGVQICGFGVAPKPDFWISGPCSKSRSTFNNHFAFRAEARSQVDEFYLAALENGGTDNGTPGLRPHYHANYYGAFVLDPDGNNIEAVCHLPA